MVDLKIELPPDFWKEEIRSGYTVTAQMKRVWAVELDLLKELLRVCDKYGLICYADAGTLLGAVRHKGFIPWDDDIDMVMFRDDYEKLKEVASREFSEPYFFQTAYTDKRYVYGHAQLRNKNTTAILESDVGKRLPYVQGIFIDIFVLDGVVRNKLFLCIQRRLAEFLDELIRCCVVEDEYLKWKGKIVSRILRILNIGYLTLYRTKDWIIRKGDIKSCENVAPLGFVFETEKRIRSKALYDETVWINFENMKVPAPIGYDEFLHRRYGQYMECKRIPTTHGGVVFDADNSYTKYLN